MDWFVNGRFHFDIYQRDGCIDERRGVERLPLSRYIKSRRKKWVVRSARWYRLDTAVGHRCHHVRRKFKHLPCCSAELRRSDTQTPNVLTRHMHAPRWFFLVRHFPQSPTSQRCQPGAPLLGGTPKMVSRPLQRFFLEKWAYHPDHPGLALGRSALSTFQNAEQPARCLKR